MTIPSITLRLSTRGTPSFPRRFSTGPLNPWKTSCTPFSTGAARLQHHRGFENEYSSTYEIPKFKSMSKGDPRSNQVFQYFMAGSMGLLMGVGAKATVHDFLVNMAVSGDVLAQAKVELDLSSIPEGKNIVIKWRGKPVFIRHRTEDEIKEAQEIDWRSLRDPQPDEDRVQKPEWLVMLGVCTHLGCVPIGEAGEFGGWFCPCHGSHYDISGRARKGPAPVNLEIPQYHFPNEESIVIG